MDGRAAAPLCLTLMFFFYAKDAHGAGTLVRRDDDPYWWRVDWDSGSWNNYRVGLKGKYDLM